jgi:hypothetical protein
VPFKIFFRYLTFKEKIILAIGILAAIITGVLLPAVAIVMGQIVNVFAPDNSE